MKFNVMKWRGKILRLRANEINYLRKQNIADSARPYQYFIAERILWREKMIISAAPLITSQGDAAYEFLYRFCTHLLADE